MIQFLSSLVGCVSALRFMVCFSLLSLLCLYMVRLFSQAINQVATPSIFIQGINSLAHHSKNAVRLHKSFDFTYRLLNRHYREIGGARTVEKCFSSAPTTMTRNKCVALSFSLPFYVFINDNNVWLSHLFNFQLYLLSAFFRTLSLCVRFAAK